MALYPLTNPRACTAYWRRCVESNLAYWQDFLARHREDTTALDGEWETMTKAIALGLELAPAWPQVFGLITGLADFMERRGYWDNWRAILSRARTVVPQPADEVTLIALSARLWQRQSRFKPLVADYRRAIRLARRVGNRFEEGRACTNLGYFYVERGQWYRAEVLCCHALRLFEEIDNDHGRAHTENHLGILYTRQGRWAEAEQHLQQACAIWQEMGDAHGLMRGFINLCLLYLGTVQPDKVLFYAKQSLQLAKNTQEELEIGRAYLNIGTAYQLKGALTQAETYTRRAETIFQRFANTPGLINCIKNLGVIYLAQQKWIESAEYLEKALKGFRVLQSKPDEIQTIMLIVEHDLAVGRHQEASVWLEEAAAQLNRYPQVGQYYRLSEQIHKLRRQLEER